ncbi:MAG TPA: MOSC domain-containing protein [Candidatus Acidoferrales bacterium]|nr:MOSC domain-containing protein [Candidatus Acidoferrales bacterium]
MRIVSVNVGLPRQVDWAGKAVATAIYKQPVEGSVRLRRLNLAGDSQADLGAHGGPRKAVYAFPSENYGFWRDQLPGVDLGWGAFGENLTTEGWDEEAVALGDRFRIRSAIVQVTQPRIPCYKLGIRLGRDDAVARFLATGRTGFYMAVLEEGELQAGDQLELVGTEMDRLAVADVARLYAAAISDRNLLQRAAEMTLLPASWRRRFAARLAGHSPAH